MDKYYKIRPLYLARIFYEKTDENHSLTTSQLITELKAEYGIDAHRQTIKSDIELLQQFGMNIHEVKSSQNKYNLADRRFSMADLKMLTYAMASSCLKSEAESKKLSSKLQSLTSEYNRPELCCNIDCESSVRSERKNLFSISDTVNSAINSNKKISFQYFHYNVKKEKKIEQDGQPYIITPLCMTCSENLYYIIGILNDAKHPAAFRADRIVGIPKILDEEDTIQPEGSDLKLNLNVPFGTYETEGRTVELICDNGVMDDIITRFGENVTTYAYNMSCFRAVVTVAVNSSFYGWVFEFGGKVKIKTPEDVKDSYSNMIRNAVNDLSMSE